jgi:two-component system, OmpR family, phosphate regulon sensor histidine kinase PhoR
MSIRWKLPLVIALTTLIFAGVVALASALVLRSTYLTRLEDDMSRQAHEFAAVLADPTLGGYLSDTAKLQALARATGTESQVRLTVIASDGRVLADTDADPATLENHKDRPEVAEALRGSEGRARRYSSTLKEQVVYVAIPLVKSTFPWSAGVARAAIPANRINAMLSASWRVPLIVWAILLIPTVLASYLLTRSFTRRARRLTDMAGHVANGDLSFRNRVGGKDELGELGLALNGMAGDLQSRIDRLASEEETSKELLNAMSDGVLTVDAEDRLVRSNPAAARILGVSLEGVEGKPLVLAARNFPARSLVSKATELGRPYTEVLELPGPRYLAVEVVPVTPRTTGQPATLFVIRDETARRQLDKVRRDFVTNVSHELKTPLAGLSLLAETLQHAFADDPVQAHSFLTRLSSEIKRLTQLVNDLLTLSLLEEPAVQEIQRFSPVDLGAVAGAVVDELRETAQTKNQQVTLRVVGRDFFVPGDAVSLHTMVRNLVDNAIRYTEPGGHIGVSIRRDTDAEGPAWVVVEVADDGVGIPASEQARIFERFYRVDKARSRETGGTGLGLSIVRHVAERHGGRVKLRSTLGVGSTFTVSIPGQE